MGQDAAPLVGVLAYQGGVREHVQTLASLGVRTSLVRTPDQLAAVDALVIPGGESSVIDRLAGQFGTRGQLRARLADGMPALGTCAGLILLAETVLDPAPGQTSFGGLDITVQRNAFGRQVDSFEAELDVPALGAPPVRAVFIRAPIATDVGPRVEVLARAGEHIVAVRQAAVIGLSFHPELTGETRFHEALIAQIPRR